MKKRFRVTSKRGFDEAMKRPRVMAGAGMIAFASPGAGRIGIAVSKQLKKAHERNRGKRRLREIARLHLLAPTGPVLTGRIDLILVAKANILSISNSELESDAHRLLSKLDLMLADVEAARTIL